MNKVGDKQAWTHVTSQARLFVAASLGKMCGANLEHACTLEQSTNAALVTLSLRLAPFVLGHMHPLSD